MLMGLEAAGGRDPVIPPVTQPRAEEEPRIQCVEIRTELSQGVELEAPGPPAPLGLRC